MLWLSLNDGSVGLLNDEAFALMNIQHPKEVKLKIMTAEEAVNEIDYFTNN